MNGKPSHSSFPRNEIVEEPSYRRRPVSRGANTNFERHHFQSHRFPFPEAHAKAPESGNPIPHSAISRALCGENLNMRDHSQTVSPTRRLSARVPESGSNTLHERANGARQNENGKKKRGFGSILKLSHFLKLSHILKMSHFLKLSHTRAQSFIGTKMNGKPSYSSFPRKKTVEKPSYRRRPVSRGANTNFERHHFQSHRFPSLRLKQRLLKAGIRFPTQRSPRPLR